MSKPRPAIKDWISLGFSSLAFVMSIFSLYYSALRQHDELKVYVEYPPEIVVRDGKWLDFDQTETQFVFINSGDRPITISNMIMHGEILSLKTDTERTVLLRAFKFDPFTVKSKEILQKKVSLERLEMNAGTSLTVAGDWEISAQIEFRFFAPDEKRVLEFKELYQIKVNKTGGVGSIKGAYDDRFPIVVYENTSLKF